MHVEKFKQFEINNQEQVKAGYFKVTGMRTTEELETLSSIKDVTNGVTTHHEDVPDQPHWYVGYEGKAGWQS